MVDFAAKTYASDTAVLFDVKMGASGTYIVPAPSPSNSWTPLKRDGSGNYELAANTGFGNANAGGSALSGDEMYAYISHLTTIYRGARSGPGSDDFAFAPDNWSIATGTIRAMDVSPDNEWVAVGVGNSVTVYNTVTKIPKLTLDTGSIVEHVGFSPLGNYLIAGSRDEGLFLWHITGTTYTQITSGSLPSAGFGNWSVTWYADETMFVASQHTGLTPGLWVYLLTDPGTHEFTRQLQSIFDVPISTNAIACTFLNRTDFSDYLLACPFGSAQVPTLYEWDGSDFTTVATTGLGSARTYEYFRGSDTGVSIVWSDGTGTPKAGVWEFASVAPVSGDIEADFPFADFDAEAAIKLSVVVSADLPFADVEASATVGATADIEADLPFADLDAIGILDNEVTPGSPVRVHTAQIFTGAGGAVTSSLVADDFAYVYNQDFPFADFDAEAFTGADVTVEADFPFSDFDALVDQYPEITVDADFPFADFDGEVLVENRTADIEADLPFADFEAEVFSGVAVYVEADLPFADFDAEAFQTIIVFGYANLPFADFDAELIAHKIDGEIEADFPFADFDAEVSVATGVIVEADFPFADFDGLANVPVVGDVEADLPFADFDAEAAVPFTVDINASFPFADFDGLLTNTNLLDIEADLPFADFDAEAVAHIRIITIDADLPFADFDAHAAVATIQINFPPPTLDRRKHFWTTQPNACGETTDPCGNDCGLPGLQIDRSAGVTIANNDWIRGLLLNIFGTNARLPDTECGVLPGTQQGHWSESYREDGLYVGTKMRYQKPTGRILEAVALLRAQVVADANKLVALGVAINVEVESTYKGGNKVSVVIYVTGPSSSTNVVNLSATRLQNQWVWA